MVIHAYSDDYLTSAQRILGDMLDFAVNTYDMDIDKFFEMFLVSNVSRQFEIGNPTYVAGKLEQSGTEGRASASAAMK